MTVPRPGHADLTGAVKYGYRDLRVALERASARETTMRVAAGALCKAYLGVFGLQVGGYVLQIGDAKAEPDSEMAYEARFAAAEANDVRSPTAEGAERMHDAIHQAKVDRDTLGGVIEVVALGVPPGLGSHIQYDRRLDAKIVGALVSVHAMKGAEIGPAFENAGKRGTQVHDEIGVADDGSLTRYSNRAGGLEGGITTGEPVVARVAMKPIATVLQSLRSVDLATGEPAQTVYERSDFCAVPRAVPIIEAMLALVLTEALLEKLGGDSIEEQRARFALLRRNHVSDLPMNNTEWRFGYPE
jgi:chorismate synthase